MQVEGNTEGPMQAAAVEEDVHLPGDASVATAVDLEAHQEYILPPAVLIMQVFQFRQGISMVHVLHSHICVLY